MWDFFFKFSRAKDRVATSAPVTMVNLSSGLPEMVTSPEVISAMVGEESVSELIPVSTLTSRG